MITLALDTSTEAGSVALLRDDHPLVERTFGRGELFSALADMDVCAVDLFAVGLGPGSFTGIRAGIAAVKGLALPTGRPIRGAGSFDALALTARARMPRQCLQMCVLGDARRGEIYHAWYDREGRCTRQCQIGRLAALADGVQHPIWFISSEIERFGEDLKALPGGLAVVAEKPVYPGASAVGRLARARVLTRASSADLRLEPIYLRSVAYAQSLPPSPRTP